MKPETDYHRRINAVVNHVAQNLDKPLSIDELSSVAHLSKFHFHRVFRAITGETIAKMVNRLRLESAAATLIYQKNRTITQIAMDHGYSSSANFTKAFSQYFGSPPTVYRTTYSRQPTMRKNGKALALDVGGKYALNKRVEIIDQSELELAYTRRTGAYEHKAISRMHTKVRQWVDLHGCEAERPLSVGITWSDSHIAAEERWRYDACLAVKKGTIGKDGVHIQTLHGTKTAQLKISLAAYDNYDLSPYWNWFVGSWLPNSQFELDISTSFEIYENPTPEKPFIVRLCLPLRQNSV